MEKYFSDYSTARLPVAKFSHGCLMTASSIHGQVELGNQLGQTDADNAYTFVFCIGCARF